MFFYEGCTIEEIRTFRELENETFDFGEGEMRIEGEFGSEDVYYRMCLPEYNDTPKEYRNAESNSKLKPRRKCKLNPYVRKQITKSKLDKLDEIGVWWAVQNMGTHKRRCYIGSRTSFHKKISNKKSKES